MQEFESWLNDKLIQENYVGLAYMPAQIGDMIYFGIHDISELPIPIDPSKLNFSKMATVNALDPSGKVKVVAPKESRYRDIKPGSILTINQSNLTDVSHHLSALAQVDTVDGERPRKLFIYTPRKYHKTIVAKKSNEMRQKAKEKAELKAQKASMVPNITKKDVDNAKNWLLSKD